MTQNLQEPPVYTRSVEDEAAMWDQVEVLQEQTGDRESVGGAGDKGGVRSRDGDFDPITWQAAIAAFSARDFVKESAEIVRDNRPGNAFLRFFWHIFGPPSLGPSLQTERDILFCTAKVPLDHSDVVSERMLQTIYMRLTGNQRFAPSIGPHWEVIGFQGQDPATDVRGAGMLGLLHLLYFVTKYKEMALPIYNLSRDARQEFPFCVSSLSMTRITIEALRDGKLNKEANKRNSIFEAVHLFYMSLYWRMYTQWRRRNLTIRDFGTLLNELTKYGKEHVSELISSFEKAVSERLATTSESVDKKEEIVQF